MSMVRKMILPPLITPYRADKMETEHRTSLDGHQDVFVVASPAGVVTLRCLSPLKSSEEELKALVIAPMPIRGGSCLPPDKRLIPYGKDTRYFRQQAPSAAAGARGPVPVR